MHYKLPPNLSYCMVDGHPIFLDTDEDRYFRLSGSLAEAFRAYVAPGSVAGSSMGMLVDHAILVPASGPENRCNEMPSPARSAIELATSSGTARIASLLQVFHIVWRTRRDLATRALKDVLHDIVRHREERRHAEQRGDSEASVLEAASCFNRARLYVPIDTCCLLDSLALTTYLADRGATANIVFGVTDPPFSAHCWVQAGDVVLNDTVGNTMAYTPIRTI